MSEIPEKFRVVGYFWSAYSAHHARKDCEKQNPTKKYRYLLQLIEYEAKNGGGLKNLRRSVENIEKKFLEVEGERGKLMQCPSSRAACMQVWDIASKQTNVLLKGLSVVESAISNSFNPTSPKAGTIATCCHSPPSSISPRRSWQSTFQRLRNGENLKNRGNAMLKAGEWCPTPFFQGAEGRGHRESLKRRFEGPNGIEACFRLLFEGFVGGRVRV